MSIFARNERLSTSIQLFENFPLFTPQENFLEILGEIQLSEISEKIYVAFMSDF